MKTGSTLRILDITMESGFGAEEAVTTSPVSSAVCEFDLQAASYMMC